jgi:AraC-like DNA-binding protein
MPLRTFNHARPDLTPYGFTCELWKGALMCRPDRHNEIELNLMLRGVLTYLIGGQRVTLGEKSLGAFWAALPHQIIGSEGQPQYYVVTLPLAWFLQCQLPAPLVDRLLAGQFLRESVEPRLELDLALFGQWERDLPGPAAETSPAAKLELHARMLRFAANLPETPTRRNSRAVAGEAQATKAEQMASYIARHYREPLAAEDVAGHVRLHTNYAMTLFKQTFRTTLNDYLIHYRIAQAQRLLATTEEKVIDIAFDAGFRTSSRFYEAFRKACGCSPSRYRRAHRIGAA